MKENPFLAWFRLDLLLIFVPAALYLRLTDGRPDLLFVAAALAIIPLAGWMGRATEHLATRMGSGVGGLLNATFGNAAELIIALLALRKGLIVVVKASLTGSIIGNILLVLGASILAGGVKHARQTFNRTSASLSTTMLVLSVFGMLLPVSYHWIATQSLEKGQLSLHHERFLEHSLSLEIAIVLFVVYILSLIFSLRTHKDIYRGEEEHETTLPAWSVGKSLGVLAGATLGVALLSEFLVGAVEAAAHSWGLSDIFVGVVVVALVGNAAEHSTAILVALRNKMDLAFHVAIGSSTQVALFVAPVLVFASYLFPQRMDLLFTPFEVLAMAMATGAVVLVAQDGECHWMEGVLLLALYLMIGFAFFLLPV